MGLTSLQRGHSFCVRGLRTLAPQSRHRGSWRSPHAFGVGALPIHASLPLGRRTNPGGSLGGRNAGRCGGDRGPFPRARSWPSPSHRRQGRTRTGLGWGKRLCTCALVHLCTTWTRLGQGSEGPRCPIRNRGTAAIGRVEALACGDEPTERSGLLPGSQHRRDLGRSQHGSRGRRGGGKACGARKSRHSHERGRHHNNTLPLLLRPGVKPPSVIGSPRHGVGPSARPCGTG